jgi:hypothetical protein
MSIKGLNEELSAAPALHIELLTSEELGAVAGGIYADSDSLDGGCTCGTRSICHIDGTDDSD